MSNQSSPDKGFEQLWQNFVKMNYQQQQAFMLNMDALLENPFLVTDEELRRRVRMGKEAQAALDSRRNA